MHRDRPVDYTKHTSRQLCLVIAGQRINRLCSGLTRACSLVTRRFPILLLAVRHHSKSHLIAVEVL